MFYKLKTPRAIKTGRKKKRTVITQLKTLHETSLFRTIEKRASSISIFFSRTVMVEFSILLQLWF